MKLLSLDGGDGDDDDNDDNSDDNDVNDDDDAEDEDNDGDMMVLVVVVFFPLCNIFSILKDDAVIIHVQPDVNKFLLLLNMILRKMHCRFLYMNWRHLPPNIN